MLSEVSNCGTGEDLRSGLLDSGLRLPTSLMFFSLAHLTQTALATSLGCALELTVALARTARRPASRVGGGASRC